MIDYRSDNTGRAAPEILDAMLRANTGTTLGYGGDEWTARLQDRFSELFETPVRVFPVATGTAANALSLAAIGPGWGNIYCSELAHINTSEANATGFLERRAETRAGCRRLWPHRPGGAARDARRARPGRAASRQAVRGQYHPGQRSRRGLCGSTTSAPSPRPPGRTG